MWKVPLQRTEPDTSVDRYVELKVSRRTFTPVTYYLVTSDPAE